MNRRQRQFVDEYLIDLNATQAAIRAGYSEKTARAIGAENLTKPDIATAIQQAMNARAARTLVTQDRVLDELAVLSFSNHDDYVIDENGNLSLAPNARPDAMRAVASVKRKRRIIPQKDGEAIVETEVEYRLWSKPETLRLTGQHLGMYVERKEITIPSGAGVLAIPVAPDAAQWAAGAAAQQAALTKRSDEPT